MSLNLSVVLVKMDLKKNKIEGDLSTPKGKFDLENLYYRNDKLDKPLSLN